MTDATDYTKRKHVFKLLSKAPQHHSTTATIGQTEILVQAENDGQMGVWRDLLQSVCDPNALLKKVSEMCAGDKERVPLLSRDQEKGFAVCVQRP